MPDSGKPGVRKTGTGKLGIGKLRTRRLRTVPVTAAVTAALTAGALSGPAQPAATATRAFDTCPQGYVWPLDATLKLYFKNTVPGRVAAGITQRRLDDM